jgi:anaerobic magnesium-protoporphyrin IX monomethyl ester cyclase
MYKPLSDSKKRILVVAPPYRLSPHGFPLGLMYIAASLQYAGHHVEAIDMDALNLPGDDYIRELKNRDYDYFCTGGMITAWNFLKFSCEAVRKLKPQAKIIVGGGCISSSPKSFVSVTSADIGVVGEGEETILEIIDAFENKKSLSDITGIVYKNEAGEVLETGRRHYLDNLDDLPFPAWDLFDVKNIYSRFPSHYALWKAKRVATIYTTRGCPFQCTFCYTEKAVRQRSIENIMDEIKELKRRYNVGHLHIADDLFVVRKKRTIEFCEAMIKNKMNVTWSATGRCNIVEPEFLKIMRAAGCEFLGLGIESGSATVLKKIKKSQTPEQIVQAVKMVTKAGITPGGSFIIGLPPETPETVRETVEVYKQINGFRTHVNRFFFATPYPGTELYDQMRAAGKIPDEIAHFEKLSERGDATDFMMNCTEAFTDEELIKTKSEIEKELFEDFLKKHPKYAITQFIDQKTPWGKIHIVLMKFRMFGFRAGIAFLYDKLLTRMKLRRDRFRRQNWKKPTELSYLESQVMIEGQMPTF